MARTLVWAECNQDMGESTIEHEKTGLMRVSSTIRRKVALSLRFRSPVSSTNPASNVSPSMSMFLLWTFYKSP